MPHSVPVSKVMTPPNQWPQIRGEADVCTAVKLLRIITEDEKLEHGHSPLIMDEDFNLMGFVHLSDLLKKHQEFVGKAGRRRAQRVHRVSADKRACVFRSLARWVRKTAFSKP